MMKKRENKPATEDVELLRASLADVVPLPRANRAHTAATPPQPIPVQRLRDERAALADSLSPHVPWDSGHETGEELAYLRPGLPSVTLRKLRRGHWVLQDEIDLHGSTTPEARALLSGFLADCLRRGLRCVRVIHGKGLRSKNREPVLKQKVARWLMQRDDVLAYCQARRTEGGSGAVVVLLKPRKN
ncbi:MAG TPA: Smr/MutS family protein [Burkholderiales bacterium]|nr:Smr/MutS family protein [Burkholderiales bacterium]